MHIQVFANGKNTGYGRNTHQKFQTVRDVKHHVPGNGKKQYVQGAAGCVLDQHADKFNADYQIERVLKEHMKRIIVGIVQEPRHIFYQWYNTDNEANQYDDRHGDFKDFRQQLNPVCESMIFDGTAPDFPFHLLGELFLFFIGIVLHDAHHRCLPYPALFSMLLFLFILLSMLFCFSFSSSPSFHAEFSADFTDST